MKKSLIILCFLTCTILGYINYKVFKNIEDKSSLTLLKLDALASGEGYPTGPAGTNWKTYRTDCVYTKRGSTVIHLGPLGSIGWDTGNDVTWTENKDVCGSGAGMCLASAGC